MKYLKMMSLLVLTIVAYSCSSDDTPPKPVADFQYNADDMDPLTITFAGTATDAKSYEWNFGDGETSNELSPVHTYVEPGTYSVTFTASGDGGEGVVTKNVEVLPSLEFLLTGGKNATNGKTWKFKYEVSDPVGKEGAGAVKNDLAIQLPIDEDGFLDWISLPQGYNDKFTFFYGGKYVVDNSDFFGGSLMGLVYAAASGEYDMKPASDGGDILGLSSELDIAPLADIIYTPKKEAHWSFNYENFDIDALDLTTGVPYTETFTGKTQLVLDEYLLFKDYKTNVIIKEIYKNEDTGKYEMNVAITLYAAKAAPTLATHLVHLTLVEE